MKLNYIFILLTSLVSIHSKAFELSKAETIRGWDAFFYCSSSRIENLERHKNYLLTTSAQKECAPNKAAFIRLIYFDEFCGEGNYPYAYELKAEFICEKK